MQFDRLSVTAGTAVAEIRRQHASEIAERERAHEWQLQAVRNEAMETVHRLLADLRGAQHSDARDTTPDVPPASPSSDEAIPSVETYDGADFPGAQTGEVVNGGAALIPFAPNLVAGTLTVCELTRHGITGSPKGGRRRVVPMTNTPIVPLKSLSVVRTG